MAKRLRVYVAGPYSADNVLGVLQNIGRGERACAELFHNGLAPFCPWHDKTYAMDALCQGDEVEAFREHSMAWLEAAQAVFVLPGWEQSEGTKAEMLRAENIGIPVFFNMLAVLGWAADMNEQANG